MLLMAKMLACLELFSPSSLTVFAAKRMSGWLASGSWLFTGFRDGFERAQVRISFVERYSAMHTSKVCATKIKRKFRPKSLKVRLVEPAWKTIDGRRFALCQSSSLS
jgi:hypothetical protein